MLEASDVGLRPLVDFFPGRSRRWISDLCRSDKRPTGAVKVGASWMIRAADFERWLVAQQRADRPALPTVDDALADLRRRGAA